MIVRTKTILLGSGLFLAGLLLGTLPTPLHNALEDHYHINDDAQERVVGDYRFVSPLLACGETKLTDIGNDTAQRLESDLQSFVRKTYEEGRAENVGIYFRQLRGGPWLGVNYEQEFTPGSLLKVPLAMALYKTAEHKPGFLDTHVVYESGDTSHLQYFKNIAIEPGQSYSVRELIHSMLAYSDNNAADVAAATLSDKELTDTYRKLGIQPPNRTGDYETTVRDYASFFRILYNATYLTPEDSEAVLGVLSDTTFTRGLVSGLPSHVTVAHKFGERALPDSDLVQLHDCGIVYHPERPYVICVMTQGRAYETLATVIADVSRMVWKHID